ncbi:uncharacterized protein YALI1_E26532g [Yarrowia lipolytica]|uniref:Uncharacterized protein n=1 Tax=Yarrowia lipolytica TaxID=4952 RepID=A0A1D8NJI6_YARLL|nr:hypothetical protein YALI1_E26532g [Yarrowia lipolytica]
MISSLSSLQCTTFSDPLSDIYIRSPSPRLPFHLRIIKLTSGRRQKGVTCNETIPLRTTTAVGGTAGGLELEGHVTLLKPRTHDAIRSTYMTPAVAWIVRCHVLWGVGGEVSDCTQVGVQLPLCRRSWLILTGPRDAWLIAESLMMLI